MARDLMRTERYELRVRSRCHAQGTAQNLRGLIHFRNNIVGAPSFSPYCMTCFVRFVPGAPGVSTDPVLTDSLLSGGTLLCSAPHGLGLIPLADSRPQTFCGSVQQKSRLLAFFGRMRIH